MSAEKEWRAIARLHGKGFIDTVQATFAKADSQPRPTTRVGCSKTRKRATPAYKNSYKPQRKDKRLLIA